MAASGRREGGRAVQRESFVDLGFKLLSTTHRGLWRLSGGRILGSAFGMTVAELHTIGRKSGQPRVTMLTAPIHDAAKVVLVASKGGDDRHPQWYRNLTVHPEVEILIEGTLRQLRARTASATEKAELWPQILRAYQGYGDYQEKAARDIPVVICEPR
jgi:deazaflavin-dependent oxidoreductase (nitroreductase family)